MYNIAYVTSSRADYGIVRNFLKLLNNDTNIKLDIIVTGALLDKKYGESYHIIENDGLNIAKKISLELKSTENKDITNSMAIALKEFGDFFANNFYDLIIILGDRYEMLSVATAAAINKMRILHLHGGEKTLGNYDEFIRHSISKMSYFHFTSTEEYRNRVIQLGENENRVFNIGAMGAENSTKIELSNVDKNIIKLKSEKYFVVLFHPETLTKAEPKEQIKILLKAISSYIKEYRFIFLGTNADSGANQIREEVKNFIGKNENILYFENLHPDSYHYMLKNAVALIGNSSSGIIEAPSLGCYTINIGDRQKGRVKSSSVIDVECNINSIIEAIDKTLELPKNEMLDNPYYKGKSSKMAYDITVNLLKEENIIKEFYDIEYN